MPRFSLLIFIVIACFAVFAADAHASAIIGRPLYLGLDQGLVGWWTFDGNHTSGTHVYDASGNGNRGTMTNGPKLVNGKLGQGMEFDGVNNHVRLPNDLLDSHAAGSLCSWIRLNVLSDIGGQYHIIGYGDATGASQKANLYVSDITTDDAMLAFFLRTELSNEVFIKSNNGVISRGAWQHVCVIQDGTGVKLYADGVLLSTTVTASGSTTDEMWFADIASTAENVSISGTIDNSPSEYFQGAIDDVRIYNRALAADEIKRLYKIGATAKVGTSISNDSLQKGLVGYWNFDGKTVSGTHVYDQSGNDNRGIMTNGPKLVNGKIGQGLQLDGVDDYVATADSDILDTGDYLTLSVWFKSPGLRSEPNILVIHDNSAVGAYGLGIPTGGFRFTTRHAVAGLRATPTAGIVNFATYADNAWHHAVGVYDRYASSRLKFYVDGVLKAQAAGVDETIQDGDEGIWIGRLGSRQFNGFMDDVRIYNRALSADEIKRLYNRHYQGL